MGKPPVDILPFYQAAYEAYETARRSIGDTPQIWLELAGSTLCLTFAGEAMMTNVVPALAHLSVAPQPRADLEIAIWDSVSTATKMPSPPWSVEDYMARGEISNHSGKAGIDVAYHPGSDMLSLLQANAGTAMLWTHDANQCPYWEQAAPLRSILHWWCSRRNQQLAHGAAVGTSGGAVLLTGKGGSGKSTTALSALLAGMDYIGDDYVLCDLAGVQPRVHSLFNSAKLDTGALRRLPELRSKLNNMDRPEDEKGVIFTHQHFPSQLCSSRLLRAILIPRVCDSTTSRIVPLRPARAYLALSPTTVFQLPGAKQASMSFLKQLVERLPCFQLELGGDPAKTAALIGRFIEQPA